MTYTVTRTITPTYTSTREPVTGAYEAYLNCGGDAPFTDLQGRIWKADKLYWPGSYGAYEQYYPYGNSETYNGTNMQALYTDTMEYPDPIEYRFDVPAGDYRVTLFMAEYLQTLPGQRVMDIYIEGLKVAADLDLIAAAGYLNAYEPSFDAAVTDGTLNIRFVPKTDWVMIAAIGVQGLQADLTPEPTRTPPVNGYMARIDCGGTSDYTALDGRVWEADRVYAAGGYGLSSSTGAITYGGAVGNIKPTLDDLLYASYRNGPVVEYKFSVAPGLYTVGMLWSELAYYNKGDRVFDVYIEGSKVISDADIINSAGYSNSYDRYFYDIEVTDGTLNVKLQASADSAMLAAIEVLGQQSLPTATPTSTITQTPTASPTISQTHTITETMTGTPPTATASPTITNTAIADIADILRFETLATPAATVGIDGSVVTQRVRVIGSVSMENLSHWSLEYAEAGKEEWTEFAQGTSLVTEGELGIFDPTMMLNGQYNLRLSVYDTGTGVLHSASSSAFTVDGQMKIGNFTLSFTDLSVPVAGVPLEVVRSYDSRVKTKGDFGIGWTLDIKNMRVQESCVPGEYWNGKNSVRPRNDT